MLTELCGYLKNYFEVKKCFGNFKIVNGHISFADGTELPLQDGQHFRIIGSIFNDGVFRFSYPPEEGESESVPDEGSSNLLKDEEFKGAVWTMAVPREVIALANEIAAWRAKYENLDSQAMSPYNSESFGGYSYSKSAGGSADGSGGAGWQNVYGNRLSRYRKV